MKKFSVFTVLAMLFLVLMAVSAMAGPGDTYAVYPISADPCLNSSVTKTSAVVSVSTGTTALVSLSASKSIFVCSLSVVPTGTTPDFQLVTGTTSTCYTSMSTLTGVMKPLTGTAVNLRYGGTVVKGVSGGAICAVMSASTTTATGVITYVKQ